jgi:geranylgeranyl pyrophosphate synthase
MHSDDEPSIAQVELLMIDLVREGSGEAGRAAAFHLAAGGSRVRARLALDAARALALRDRDAIAIAATCELLHNASLVHDDLQDRDVVRRGQDAVWRRYGAAAAICVGDLLLSAAYAALARTGPAAAALIVRMHQRVAAVISGQCHDIALQGRAIASLETYEQVARAKSGPLLILPTELALALAGHEDAIPNAVEAGALFAVGYQIADDLEDVQRDALTEELNIVAVLAAAGETQPQARARDLAVVRFGQAHAAATVLPCGCGALLAAHALRQCLSLSPVLETA